MSREPVFSGFARKRTGSISVMPVLSSLSVTKQLGPERPGAENLGSTLLSNDTWPRIRQTLGLSPRELQVMQGVFRDDKDENIANELGISRHTVNTYLRRLYSKLCVCSRSQLIIRVIAVYLSITPSPVRHPD